MPRHESGPPPSRSHQKLILCLWSAGGEEVARIEAFGAVATAPTFCVHEKARYEKMDPPTRAGAAHIVHYQTRTLVRRVAS